MGSHTEKILKLDAKFATQCIITEKVPYLTRVYNINIILGFLASASILFVFSGYESPKKYVQPDQFIIFTYSKSFC